MRLATRRFRLSPSPTSHTSRIAARTTSMNAKNGQDVPKTGTPFATTVTAHSREATSRPSDTVTFTVCAPVLPDPKSSALVFPPVTVPSTLHVYDSTSPSGSHAMTVNVCVAPASTVRGPTPGLLDVI